MPMDVATKNCPDQTAGRRHPRPPVRQFPMKSSTPSPLARSGTWEPWQPIWPAEPSASRRPCAGAWPAKGGPPEGETLLATPDQVQAANATSNVQVRHDWGDDLLDNFRQNYEDLDVMLQGWTDWSIGCWHRRRWHHVRRELCRPPDPGTGNPRLGTCAPAIPAQGDLDGDGIVALLPASEMLVPTVLPAHRAVDDASRVSLRDRRRSRGRDAGARRGGHRRRLQPCPHAHPRTSPS